MLFCLRILEAHSLKRRLVSPILEGLLGWALPWDPPRGEPGRHPNKPKGMRRQISK